MEDKRVAADRARHQAAAQRARELQLLARRLQRARTLPLRDAAEAFQQRAEALADYATILGPSWARFITHLEAERYDATSVEQKKLERIVTRLEPLHAALGRLTKRVEWRLAQRPAHDVDALAHLRARVADAHALDLAALTTLAREGDSAAFRDGEARAVRARFDSARAAAPDDAHVSAALDEMVQAEVIQPSFVSAYRAHSDKGDDFSNRLAFATLPDLVVHAHCTAAGLPKAGDGTHWKWHDEEYDVGPIRPLSDELRLRCIALVRKPKGRRS